MVIGVVEVTVCTWLSVMLILNRNVSKYACTVSVLPVTVAKTAAAVFVTLICKVTPDGVAVAVAILFLSAIISAIPGVCTNIVAVLMLIKLLQKTSAVEHAWRPATTSLTRGQMLKPWMGFAIAALTKPSRRDRYMNDILTPI